MTREITPREDDRLTEVRGRGLLAPIEHEDEPDADLEALAQAADAGPVKVLDLAQCHTELTEAGLEIPDLNGLADALADGGQLRETTKPLEDVALLSGAAVLVPLGVLLLLADHTDWEILDAAAKVWLGLVIALVVLGVGSAVAFTRLTETSFERLMQRPVPVPAVASRRRALKIVAGCVSEQPIDWNGQHLLKRAREAAEKIVSSEVWDLEMFDDHRVRVDLIEEVQELRQIIRVVTSNTTGGNAVPARMRATVLDPAQERVRALEQYRDQVLAVQREWDRWRQAEREEIGSARLMNWLAKSGGGHSTAELQNMAAESRAAATALAETLAAMGPTAARLGTSTVDDALRQPRRSADGE